MNHKPLLAASAFVMASIGVLITPSTVLAASQDECAIWICLPGGFPSGCGAAHSAMIDRIKDRKSPLPSFSSCAVQGEGGSRMTHTYNFAALISERRVCTKRRFWGGDDYDNCIQWEAIPQHYVKGTRCYNHGDYGPTPYGCIRTYRYIDVFIDGVLAGDTYYW